MTRSPTFSGTMIAPAPKLTLRDTTDLELLVDRWIEDHIDEVELSDGALPDDLAQLLDEVQASRAERADAIAFKLDRLAGDVMTAKATKDRAARRERVAANVIKAIKAYAKREVERGGGEPIKGTACVLRIQKNGGKPAVDVRFENEQLLAFADSSVPHRNSHPLAQLPTDWAEELSHEPHPLARFIVVQRVAQVDTDRLALAYQARRSELELEVALELSAHPPTDAQVADVTARVDQTLAAEFPGVTVTRGTHLRID